MSNLDQGPALLARLEAAQKALAEAFAILRHGGPSDADRLRAAALEKEADESLSAMRQYLKRDH